jgi:SAM-dependent methyltransferase
VDFPFERGWVIVVNASRILSLETALRAWFAQNADPALAVVDGLDVGWGGVQRWATARMPVPNNGPHLDFACGYGTFLAQLGWRFPYARLIGLNINYAGPHATIGELLEQANVRASLVQADARRMPFPDGAFGSVSCFLGLQDIEIGFGGVGVRRALDEAVRVLSVGGSLVLLDELPIARFQELLAGLPVVTIDWAERTLDVRWDRRVAERAIALYAEGWIAQARLADLRERRCLYKQVYDRMKIEMERQLSEQGYYVPFGPMGMVTARKVKDLGENPIRRMT